jgi:hypothetical protein
MSDEWSRRQLMQGVGAVGLALLALIGGTATAYTQTADERVLMDVVVRVLPGGGDGHCLMLERGTLVVTLAPDGPAREPVRFGIGGWRIDSSATLQVPILAGSRTYETRVIGGLYCYSLTNDTYVDPQAGLAVLTQHGQMVRLRMALQPD